MASYHLCSFLVFLLAAPQATASFTFLSSRNVSDAAALWAAAANASASEPLEGDAEAAVSDGGGDVGSTSSDSMDQGPQAGNENLPGMGGEPASPGSSQEIQSTADAAEREADSTEPAAEVNGNVDDIYAAGEGEHDETSEANVEPLSQSESEPEEVEPEGGEPVSFAQGVSVHPARHRHHRHGKASSETPSDDTDKSFIQNKRGDFMDMSDSDVQEALNDAHLGDEENGESDAEDDSDTTTATTDQEEAEAGPPENSHAEEGSDVALYGGNDEEARSMDTTGSEEGSDMALYAKGAEEESDAAQDDSTSSDEQDEENVDPEATESLIQMLKKHAALFGNTDDDEDFDAEGESSADAEEETGDAGAEDDATADAEADAGASEDEEEGAGGEEAFEEDGGEEDEVDEEAGENAVASEENSATSDDEEESSEMGSLGNEQSDEEIEESVNSFEDEGMKDAQTTEEEAGGPDEEAAAESDEALQDETESLEASEI